MNAAAVAGEPADIPTTRVPRTVVTGETVYEADVR
jgi:hypothetical protein